MMQQPPMDPMMGGDNLAAFLNPNDVDQNKPLGTPPGPGPKPGMFDTRTGTSVGPQTAAGQMAPAQDPLAILDQGMGAQPPMDPTAMQPPADPMMAPPMDPMAQQPPMDPMMGQQQPPDPMLTPPMDPMAQQPPVDPMGGMGAPQDPMMGDEAPMDIDEMMGFTDQPEMDFGEEDHMQTPGMAPPMTPQNNPMDMPGQGPQPVQEAQPPAEAPGLQDTSTGDDITVPDTHGGAPGPMAENNREDFNKEKKAEDNAIKAIQRYLIRSNG